LSKKCICRFFSVFLSAVLLAGCAGAGVPRKEPEKTPITQTELPDIEKARELIVFGSPDSIQEAYKLLRSSPSGNSPEGQKFAYVAEQLMKVLYPRTSFEAGVSLPPTNSLYPEIFEDVRQGNFSVLMRNWDSSLMLLSVSCAALYTSDRDVLTLCGAAAQAAVGGGNGTDSVISPYVLGTIELKRENYEDALYHFERSYTKDDSMYPAKWESVKILRKIEDNGNALILLEELVHDFPDNILYQLELSSCYLDIGSVLDAMKTISAIDIQENNEYYDEYLFLKSSIEKTGGRIDAAAETAELYRERNPEDLSGLKRYGMLLLELGKTEKGVAVLEIAAGKGLDDLEVNKRLLAYYAENALWEEAEAVADRVYDDLETPDLIALTARVYKQLERFERAEILARRLVRRNPENADSYALYAEILIDLGKREEAAAAIRTALGSSTSRQQRSNLYLLYSTIAEGTKEKAERLQNALFENMENMEALLEIAYLYRGTGEFRKAYRYVKQAAVLAPDNKRVRNLYEELEGLIGE
jgi:tetratricopeptide (TPR) repeat protein